MKKQEQTRGRVFTRRALLVAGGKAALLSALAGRMYYLSVVESEKYVTLAEEKFEVRIPDDEVKNLTTVGDAVSFITGAQA